MSAAPRPVTHARLLRTARALFGARTAERVFEQLVADMDDEVLAAQVQRNGLARAAAYVRGYAALMRASATAALPMAFRFRMIAPLALALFTADCTTKTLAAQYLEPAHVPHSAIGDVVRFTLGYNQGAAMSIPVGPHARATLIAASLVALCALIWVAWTTAYRGPMHRAGLGLLLGGTLGNLFSRIASSRGVVDFIDIGAGNVRFWIFNVADIGVTLGVVLLLWAASRPVPSPEPSRSPQ